MKTFRRLLAIILTGVFAFTSGIVSDSNSIISMAAEAERIRQEAEDDYESQEDAEDEPLAAGGN